MIQLRDYQAAAVRDIRTAFGSGLTRVLLAMPTASGKTILFSHIAAGVASKGKRVIILAHRGELLAQISEALSQFQVPHEILDANTRGLPRSPVIVASVMTLVRRLKHAQTPDLIVCDEAHHCVGKTSWGRSVNHFEGAKLLGGTATPCRLDGTGLGDVFQSLVLGPTVAELTAQGWLTPAECYGPPEQLDLSAIHTRAGDYAVDELSAIMGKAKITGNAVAHYRRLADGRAAVAFCCSVQHARDVATEFQDAGYRAVALDGGMEREPRRQAIRDLATGRLQVLTSCEIVSEGVDVPRIECGIMLRPTKSEGLWLQQVGRCLRLFPNKRAAIILDHAGNSQEHGLPDSPRTWTLAGTAKTKRKKSPTALRQCPECFAIHEPAPKCPRCGHIYVVAGRTPEQVDGELRRITGNDHAWAQGISIPTASGQEFKALLALADTPEKLHQIRRLRRYHHLWVHHVLKSRGQTQAISSSTT